MLEENKRLFEDVADRIEGWRKIDKNELCRLYIKHEGNKVLSEAYLAAVMAKFWGGIGRLYSSAKSYLTPEECYDILYDSIMYVLEKRVWENENSSIYNLETAPETAINQRLDSICANYYQASQCFKRQANYNAASTEEINEEYDVIPGYRFDENDFLSNSFIKQYVIEYFKNKDYFSAFLLDAIAHIGDAREDESLNHLHLAQHMQTLDDYCEIFSETYGIPEDSVRIGIEYINRIQKYKIKEKVRKTILKLRHELEEEKFRC